MSARSRPGSATAPVDHSVSYLNDIRMDAKSSWRVLDEDDEEAGLIVHPVRQTGSSSSSAPNSLVAVDALYLVWASDATSGDFVRTHLFDQWLFHSEHTCPGSAARMQAEIEKVMCDDSLTPKAHRDLLMFLTRAANARSAADTAIHQRLRGLGYATAKHVLTLQPNAQQTVVCPVSNGDLLACTYGGAEDQDIVFCAMVVERKSGKVTQRTLSEAKTYASKNCDTEPQGYVWRADCSGEVVLIFGVPEGGGETALTVLVVKAGVGEEVPSATSKWVCAACGFSRPDPLQPVAGRVPSVQCLVCEYVEGTPRAGAAPLTGEPPGTTPAGCVSPFPSFEDKAGVLFTVPPYHTHPLINRTANAGGWTLSVDLFDRPLPALNAEGGVAVVEAGAPEEMVG